MHLNILIGAFAPMSQNTVSNGTSHFVMSTLVCLMLAYWRTAEYMGVFGSPYHLEFTLSLEISHLIQARLRICGVFRSPHVKIGLVVCLLARMG
jgi:hypothetical protein